MSRLWYSLMISMQPNPEYNNTNTKEHLLAQLKPIIIESLAKAFPQNKEVVDNLPAIFDLLGVQAPFVPDEKTRKLGVDFLHEATRDVKSCKLLYSKKLYPHAVYHLQQAVEKTIKGYVLVEGYYKATELKEITTHQSPSVLLKGVLVKTGIKHLAEKSNDKTLKAKIDDAEATIANEDKRIEIAKTSQSEIKKLLSQIEDYRKVTDLIQQETSIKLTQIALGPMPMSLFQAISTIVAIMILAIITFPHESYTRYPDGQMVPDNYNQNLGIVCATPRIVRILEAEIRNLEKIYKK